MVSQRVGETYEDYIERARKANILWKESVKGEKWFEENKEYQKRYYQENKEQILENNKEYCKEHKEEIGKYLNIWRKTKKGRESRGIERSRRKTWGNFIALNEPFEGCAGHHTCKEFVIYMPAKIHQNFSHNLETGEGMEEINKEAVAFLIRGI